MLSTRALFDNSILVLTRLPWLNNIIIIIIIIIIIKFHPKKNVE